MIRADGYVKLLDFGLAKMLPWARAGAVGTAATLTAGTQTGHLVGTFNYSSPFGCGPLAWRSSFCC